MKPPFLSFPVLRPLFVIIVFFTIQNVSCQWIWSDPTPLTNIPDWNHRNIDMLSYGSDNLWITYERYTDTNSTSICIQEILNNGDPIEVISEDAVHYTNSKLFYSYSLSQTDTLFFIFFETDKYGSNDLYYLAYLEDGTITEPVTFFNTTGSDMSIDMSFYNHYIVWISNGDLMMSKYENQNGNYLFTDPEILDTGNCVTPKFAGLDILYIKQNDTTSFVYKYNIQSEEKELIFDNGYAVNLDKDGLGMTLLTWSAQTNDLWYLYSWDPWYGYAPQFEYSTTPYDPAICSYQIGVKSSNLMGEYYLAFPWDTAGNQEIFMNLEPGNPDFINLSASGTMNRNPKSFFGEPFGYACFYGYMIWESLQNDYWQFYYSKILMCVGGVEENEFVQNFIKVHPNPVSDNLNISYFLDDRSNVKIEIFDLYGNMISTVIDEMQIKGEHSLTWSPSYEMTDGIYFILLKKENEIFSQKIIKTN